MRYLNFATLCKYLIWLKGNFLNNVFENFVYSLCKLLKVTKQYNWLLCPLLKVKYPEIYTDLFWLIIPQGFSREKYFFTFIDRATKKTETSIWRKISKWFSNLKTYYACAQTISQIKWPIQLIQTDFGLELQSTVVS